MIEVMAKVACPDGDGWVHQVSWNEQGEQVCLIWLAVGEYVTYLADFCEVIW